MTWPFNVTWALDQGRHCHSSATLGGDVDIAFVTPIRFSVNLPGTYE